MHRLMIVLISSLALFYQAFAPNSVYSEQRFDLKRTRAAIEDTGLTLSEAKSSFHSHFESPEYASLKTEMDQASGGLHSNFAELIRYHVNKNFDPKCLSSANCRVGLKVSIETDGTYKIKKVFGENDTAEDDFYCEQAVWEYAVPLRGYTGQSFLCDFSGTASSKTGNHPEIYRNATSNHVAMHLIPQYFPLVGLSFPVCALNDSFNVVLVSDERLNDPRLNEFRKQWVRFFTPPPSPSRYDELSAKALELRQKYDIFTPCEEARPANR